MPKMQYMRTILPQVSGPLVTFRFLGPVLCAAVFQAIMLHSWGRFVSWWPKYQLHKRLALVVGVHVSRNHTFYPLRVFRVGLLFWKLYSISEMYFQVSEDETMVRRTTPVPEPRNVDAETIYIVSIWALSKHLKGCWLPIPKKCSKLPKFICIGKLLNTAEDSQKKIHRHIGNIPKMLVSLVMVQSWNLPSRNRGVRLE